MADEFARDDSWSDWKGISYTASEEWAYVNGPALQKKDCTPGWRDEPNNGLTPAQVGWPRSGERLRTRCLPRSVLSTHRLRMRCHRLLINA